EDVRRQDEQEAQRPQDRLSSRRRQSSVPRYVIDSLTRGGPERMSFVGRLQANFRLENIRPSAVRRTAGCMKRWVTQASVS
ncbi:MAG: hypothetical protein KAR22_08165, partial [Gammaproteobacteria bacterium]|nr:hypothetical protein [Gammaproteobacteria bacterium]